MRSTTTLIVAMLVAVGLVVPGFAGETVESPPHDYVFVATSAIAEPSVLLAHIRDHLILAIARSGLASSGYPRPCHVSSRRDPDHEGGSLLSCSDTAGTRKPATGILLDAEGHFIQLSVIAFSDTRVYLAEIYLVPRFPYPSIGTDERFTIPRVVVHVPIISTKWHPKIWWTIQKGIEEAGARAVEAGDGTE